MKRSLAYLACVALTACVAEIDLCDRACEEPVVCSPGERHDPTTGACATCLVDTPPDALACPCGYTSGAAPFPYCEGDAARHTCLPCTSDLAACVAFDAASGTMASCELISQCCAALLREGGTPCCPLGADMDCVFAPNLGKYAVGCVEPTCCAGSLCEDGDCESWQVCDGSSGRCVPACRPQTETCCVECGCECVDLVNPP